MVDHELAVDPQSETVVPDHRERVVLGELRLNEASPANRGVIRLAGELRKDRVQVLVGDIGIDDRRPQLFEVEHPRPG
jgi:hypothetical protein